jgi:hypothetical protein
MVLPELMIRRWDGIGYNGLAEYFAYTDMRRCEYNANIIAQEAGLEPVSFIEPTRDQQFRYDEAQKLENLIYSIASSLGIAVGVRTWSYGGPLSWMDFERIESNTFLCYQALGGIGERVESHQVLVTVHATLFAGDWIGTGPYHYDLTVPEVRADSDALVYVDHVATEAQRTAEVNAVMRPVILADKQVRIYALSIRPGVNIPIKITIGMMQMSEVITLGMTWSGSGPWTQNITLQNAESVADAIIGTCDSTTDAMAVQIAESGLHVSAVNGATLTVKALFSRPTISLKLGVMYNESEVVP